MFLQVLAISSLQFPSSRTVQYVMQIDATLQEQIFS